MMLKATTMATVIAAIFTTALAPVSEQAPNDEAVLVALVLASHRWWSGEIERERASVISCGQEGF